jgi:hypothetical protein
LPRKLIVSSKPHRKFTLIDTIVLVAATAGGMALVRSSGREFKISADMEGWLWYAVLIRQGIGLSHYFLITWGPALLVIRLLPPRPMLRKVWRQPGTIACCATILAVSLQAPIFLVLVGGMDAREAFLKGFLTDSYFMGAQDIAAVVFSVLGSWLTLVLIGWWRPQPDWIDRLGRFLGFAWIVEYVIAQSNELLLALVP